MIQLVKIRSYQKKNGEIKGKHVFFDPPITASSVQDIFTDPNFFVSQIPEEERWNVYFTACKAKIGTRSIIEQDIIPFDIDNIDVDQKEKYIEPICAVIGLPSDEVGVVFSGNGIQIIVGIKDAFKTKDFFEKYREHYKSVCNRINEKLKEHNLPGDADPAVFSDSRLLRMPETLNKKPDKPERIAKVMRSVILNNGFDLASLSGIPKVKKGDHIGRRDMSRFPSPDTKSVLNGCNFLKAVKSGDHTEPMWYAALSVLARLDNGVSLSHEYSKAHPKYNKSATDIKIGQALQASGPRTCVNINSLWGFCGSCPNFQKVKSPIQIRAKDFVPETIGNKVTETFVVQEMVKYFGENIVKKNDDIFVYRKGFWKVLTSDDICTIKNKIIGMFGSDAKSKDAESAFKTLFYKIRIAPVDMFRPNPYCINFTNGTLHIFKNKDQSWGKEFKEHNREDFLINQLPYEYIEGDKEQNPHFLEMLERVFHDDSDKLEKILAIKQMYGACLLPAFPHLFMLHGKAGAGKTSVILPLYEFLKEENICSVEPYQFTGFMMESMAGKLVNIVTDINTQKPIEDSNIKKIEDRVSLRIDRKFKSSVYAPLPAIHIFGGNNVPPTLDGGSRAHLRRWTFIEFKSFQASGHYDKSFASWVFNKSPRGILNFALEGLDELLMSRGHFINPASGQEKIHKWMNAGDIIELFLNDIDAGEVHSGEIVQGKVGFPIVKEKSGRILRTVLYEIFKVWFESSGHDKFKMSVSRNTFYDGLSDKGYFQHKSAGERYILSLALGSKISALLP